MRRLLGTLLSGGATRELGPRVDKWLTPLLSLIMIAHIVMIFTYPPAILLRSFHLGIFLALGFLVYAPNPKRTKGIPFYDYVFIALSLMTAAYVALDLDRFVHRWLFTDPVLPLDFLFGGILIVLSLELARRAVGWPVVIVAIVFFVYSFVGQHMPGLFQHRGFDLDQVIETQFLSTIGIFGNATGVSATLVLMFILFGAVLRRAGGAEFFFNLGQIAGGSYRGGVAKTAVIASALFSMISGSANANVATTGTFTIPMMKRSGHSPAFAAAVESAASSSGTITPPVMGAVAFLVAEFVGVPYSEVVLVALVPALIYYVSIYFAIDLEARRLGLKGFVGEKKPDLRSTLKMGVAILIPVAWLIFRIFGGITAARAAFEGALVIVVMGILRRSGRMTLRDLMEALAEAAKGAVPVALACAVAGTIVGNIEMTGVGVKFTSAILAFAQDYLIFGLLLTALITTILGMGVPITAAYILAVALAGPALVRAGVAPLHAHFFVAWYAALATITPPVGISSYVAAAIAEANPMKVGWTAAKLAIGAFIVPFSFIYRPELLLNDGVVSTIIPLLLTVAGLYCVQIVMFHRHFITPNYPHESLLLLVGGLSLMYPHALSDVIGLGAVGLVIILQLLRRQSVVMATEESRG